LSVKRGQLVPLDLRVLPPLSPDLRVQPVLRVRLARTALMVLLVQPDPQVLLGQLVRPDRQDPRVLMVPMALQVLRVRLDPQVPLAQQERMG
jgi:hypothetical protein